MKITNLRLHRFKRFTDLSIKNLPTDTRLVLLIGSNGSGKSSILDAFNCISQVAHHGVNGIQNRAYYKKYSGSEFKIDVDLDNGKQLHCSGNGINDKELGKQFYGRPSLQIVPQIQNRAEVDQIKNDSDRVDAFILPDTRFNNDVHQYISDINDAIRAPIFKGEQADVLQIFYDFIQPLNDALNRIFGFDNQTVIRISKFEDAGMNRPPKLIFSKGHSEIPYDLLSHGEKQVIVLLLNFLVRNKLHGDNYIYFIDEMDVHLNTKLQENLLAEIVEHWIPKNGQLWTASHSLGFIEYARQNDKSVIIDLDNLDFDDEQTLQPIAKLAHDIYEIAVPKEILPHLFEGRKVVFCENLNAGYFEASLASEKILFLGVKDSRTVFQKIQTYPTFIGLRDKDFLTNEEKRRLVSKFPNYKILDYYCFENYMFHPDNIAELNLPNWDKAEYLNDILKQKNDKQVAIALKIMTARQHYEELKLPEIYNESKGDKKSVEQEISRKLASDIFDDFYPYFDMKEQFKKYSLEKFGYLKDKLVKTKWFKNQILNILK